MHFSESKLGSKQNSAHSIFFTLLFIVRVYYNITSITEYSPKFTVQKILKHFLHYSLKLGLQNCDYVRNKYSYKRSQAGATSSSPSRACAPCRLSPLQWQIRPAALFCVSSPISLYHLSCLSTVTNKK